jgi:muconolactone delta-isomerase
VIGLFTDDEASTPEQPATIDATPLAPHPHDPAPGSALPEPAGAEFLTTLTVTIPPGTPAGEVEEMYAREGRHSQRLGGRGLLLRLWRLPGTGRGLALWQVRDREQLRGILASLPLADWLTVDTVPLCPDPNPQQIQHKE